MPTKSPLEEILLLKIFSHPGFSHVFFLEDHGNQIAKWWNEEVNKPRRERKKSLLQDLVKSLQLTRKYKTNLEQSENQLPRPCNLDKKEKDAHFILLSLLMDLIVEKTLSAKLILKTQDYR